MKQTPRMRKYRRLYYVTYRKRAIRLSKAYNRRNRKKVLAYKSAWYVANRTTVLRRGRRVRNKIRKLIRAAKAFPCVKCGQSYPYYVMDLHHVRGVKHKAVGRMLGSCRIEPVVAEIAKCEPICSNCHREITYGRSRGRSRSRLTGSLVRVGDVRRS